MTPAEIVSYRNAIISSLPPETRAATEKTIEAMSTRSDEEAQVFIYIQAQAYHAYKSLAEIKAQLETAPIQADAENKPAALGQADLEELKSMITTLDGRQQTSELAYKLEEVKKAIDYTNWQISRQRIIRVGMAVFLLTLTILLTLGVTWLTNKETVHTLWEMKRHGVAITTTNDEEHECVIISLTGNIKDAWRQKTGEPKSVNIAIPLKHE